MRWNLLLSSLKRTGDFGLRGEPAGVGCVELENSIRRPRHIEAIGHSHILVRSLLFVFVALCGLTLALALGW